MTFEEYLNEFPPSVGARVREEIAKNKALAALPGEACSECGRVCEDYAGICTCEVCADCGHNPDCLKGDGGPRREGMEILPR